MNPKSSRYFTYIRPIMRSKFARTYSTLIFSLITIFIFSFYAIRPTVTTILSLQKSITEQQDILSKVKEKVSQLSQGKTNYEDIDPQVKVKLENLVPDNPALGQLINSLNYAASQAEASISGIQVQEVELTGKSLETVRNPALTPIEFTLNSQGTYTNLMRLLTTLKRSSRLVSITSINFVQPPDANLMMSIHGQAYYLKN